MQQHTKLKFPGNDENLDEFSYLYGVEMTIINLTTILYEWIVLDLKTENQGNIRVLENVLNTLHTQREKLREEYPEHFEERT